MFCRLQESYGNAEGWEKQTVCYHLILFMYCYVTENCNSYFAYESVSPLWGKPQDFGAVINTI